MRKFSLGIYPIVWIAFISFAVSGCKNEDPWASMDILEKLESFKDVTVTEITPANNYSRNFQIDLLQPLDHNDPDQGLFTQRIYLTHVDETMPLVFAPHGYRASPNSGQEISRLLETNCLNVTHRYFYDSRPDPLDWKYLTIQQAAADHHRIVKLFKKIYKGKWISSGASKSGLTALFHKRYYPDDVDATIAYVAPFTFGKKDERFPLYLSQLGGNDCYSKLKQIQIFAFNHRAEMLNFTDSTIQADTKNYSIDKELLFELNLMDYPFAYWQYFENPCLSVPDTVGATVKEIFNHYTSIAPISSFSDDQIGYFEPYVYQAVTELGAPAYDYEYLLPYLKKIDFTGNGNPNYELLAPAGITYDFFNSTTMPEIYNWLQSNSKHIIYIYGKDDPWSAGAIEINAGLDAVVIMQEGANHRVKISDLDQSEIVFTLLEDWLNIQMPASTLKGEIMEEHQQTEYFRLW